MDPAIDQLDQRRGVVGIVGASAILPVLLAVAYGVFVIGDSIGPDSLDRGTFTYFVVVPLWLSAPVITGALWRRPGAVSNENAIVAAVAISLVASVAIWRFVAMPDDCTNGPRPGAEALILPAVAVGIVLGALIARSAVVARTSFRRGISATAVLVAYGASAAASVVTIVAAVFLLGGAHCNPGN
jgi:hypothetical protein